MVCKSNGGCMVHDEIIKVNRQSLYVSLSLVIAIVGVTIAGSMWAANQTQQLKTLMSQLSSLSKNVNQDRWTYTDMRFWVFETEAQNREINWKPSKPTQLSNPSIYEEIK